MKATSDPLRELIEAAKIRSSCNWPRDGIRCCDRGERGQIEAKHKWCPGCRLAAAVRAVEAWIKTGLEPHSAREAIRSEMIEDSLALRTRLLAVDPLEVACAVTDCLRPAGERCREWVAGRSVVMYGAFHTERMRAALQRAMGEG